MNKEVAEVMVRPPAEIAWVERRGYNIPYATESPYQMLDVYLPEGEGPYPVIVAIHGGAWMHCDKSDDQVQPMLEGLKRGYAVVAVNYRLSHVATFPAQVHDIKCAIRWVRAHAGQLNFDTERIACWGGSAGAHLAALAGTTGDGPFLSDRSMGWSEFSEEVHAVVFWFGPTDFLKMDEYLAARGLGPRDHGQADSPESRLLGAPIAEVPDRVSAANPETYVTPQTPPFLLQHGTMDATVPVQHSISFAEMLRQVVGDKKVQLHLLDGAVHADPQFESPENVKVVLDFLDFHLRR